MFNVYVVRSSENKSQKSNLDKDRDSRKTEINMQ